MQLQLHLVQLSLSARIDPPVTAPSGLAGSSWSYSLAVHCFKVMLSPYKELLWAFPVLQIEGSA
jgi:hypothetical protein